MATRRLDRGSNGVAVDNSRRWGQLGVRDGVGAVYVAALCLLRRVGVDHPRRLAVRIAAGIPARIPTGIVTGGQGRVGRLAHLIAGEHTV